MEISPWEFIVLKGGANFFFAQEFAQEPIQN